MFYFWSSLYSKNIENIQYKIENIFNDDNYNNNMKIVNLYIIQRYNELNV